MLALKPRAAPRSGCSRSLANLRDVIHGSKRHPGQPPSCSPRSIGSSEFLNPIAHEVVLSSVTPYFNMTPYRVSVSDTPIHLCAFNFCRNLTYPRIRILPIPIRVSVSVLEMN